MARPRSSTVMVLTRQLIRRSTPRAMASGQYVMSELARAPRGHPRSQGPHVARLPALAEGLGVDGRVGRPPGPAELVEGLGQTFAAASEGSGLV